MSEEQANTNTEIETTEAPEAQETDWKAEAEKWKQMSRKNEERAKANLEKAKRFDDLEEESKSELQKALEAREAAEKRAAAFEVSARRAAIALKKGVDPDLLTGESEEEILAAADKLLAWRGEALKDSTPPASTSSGDAGKRGEGIQGATQLSRTDLAGMTPTEINQARREGRLNDIMGIK